MQPIPPPCRARDALIRRRIDGKTKPPGALGRLEELATVLARITGPETIRLERPTMVVFAGDHGIAAEGVSIAPPSVTRQMVLNFLEGGAAINVFCRLAGLHLEVVDAGLLDPVPPAPGLCHSSLGRGTKNFAVEPAMSLDTVRRGLDRGEAIARRHGDDGCTVFALGEMGIGNSSSAAALMGLSLGLDAESCVGRGTGVDDATITRKRSLVARALRLHEGATSPEERLAAVGGFEIVHMVGAMIGAARRGMVVLVDGFIATAAARVAVDLAPGSRDYMVFCHRSHEQAHGRLLASLDAEPLLDLGLRLGEGTGAALAFPLLRAAAAFYADMASLDEAGVVLS